MYTVYININSSTVNKGGANTMQRLRISWFLARFDLVMHGLGYILSVIVFWLCFGYGDADVSRYRRRSCESF